MEREEVGTRKTRVGRGMEHQSEIEEDTNERWRKGIGDQSCINTGYGEQKGSTDSSRTKLASRNH
eukprot:759860-Hanusia_phi.AAC.2